MDLVKTFVTLLALVDPLAIVPFFISLTAAQTKAERLRTIQVASIAVPTVIAVTALVGDRVIGILGISVPGFQVGGGIIMLLMALSMMNASLGATRNTAEETTEAESRASIAVVPLTIPLLTGPATISTVIIYANRAKHWWEYAGIIGSGILIGMLTYLCFRMSGKIAKVLGVTGINIATRVMGLLLAALAAEFIITGIVEMVPALQKS
ncbi:MAG: MarC family protein [Burkholderiaceae bacterium]